MNEKKKSLNNTDKNQKKSYKTLIGDLTQYTRDCLFPGESPVFLPPIHVVVGPNSPKKNKKRKKERKGHVLHGAVVYALH